MRVSLVITELYVGGAERCLMHLALGLQAAGDVPLVVSLGPRPPAGQAELVERLEQAGVAVSFLDARGWRDGWRARRRLSELLRRQQPDVVQSFLFHANVLTARAMSRPSPPLAAGIRVADPRRLRMWVERQALRRAQAVVCVSERVRQYAAERVGFPGSKLLVIPNGIDIQKYDSPAAADLSSDGIGAEKKVLLYVGRLDPQKGLDWLMRAVAPLLAARPDLLLVVAGQGSQLAELQRLVTSGGVASQVRFLGWRADVPQLMARADLLLLPSRWEGMPNVVLEAMAAGRAVVASRADGVEQLLGEQAGDQTFSFGDQAELQRRLDRLLADPQLRGRLGQQNRQRAAQCFSLEAMVGGYRTLYARLLR